MAVPQLLKSLGVLTSISSHCNLVCLKKLHYSYSTLLKAIKPRQKSVYWYPNPHIKQHSVFPCNWPHSFQAHTTMEIYRTMYLWQPIQSFLTVDSISASQSPAECLHKMIAFNLSVFASDMAWQPLRKVVFSWQNESFVFYHQVADLCYRNRKARTCPRKSLSLLWNYRE